MAPTERPNIAPRLQELGAVHLAGQQLVDQVVLEWPSLITAVILYPPRQFTIHRYLPPCISFLG